MAAEAAPEADGGGTLGLVGVGGEGGTQRDRPEWHLLKPLDPYQQAVTNEASVEPAPIDA